MGKRAVWLTTAAVVGLIGVLATADAMWSLLARRTVTTNQAYHRSVGEVALTVAAGEVTVQAGDDDEVVVQQRLTWSVTPPVVRKSWQGNRLAITADCPQSLPFQGCSAALVLRVPARTSIEATTAGGGALTMRDLRGPLRLNTSSGTVTGTGLRSPRVDVQAGSGPVSLGFALAPDVVRAAATSGAVDVELPADAYAVQISSVTGRNKIGVRQSPGSTHRIVLGTVTGDLRVDYSD
ncbi:hypothetical protein GCM10009565_46220 [Amycolatopsis albidoflavus]